MRDFHFAEIFSLLSIFPCFFHESMLDYLSDGTGTADCAAFHLYKFAVSTPPLTGTETRIGDSDLRWSRSQPHPSRGRKLFVVFGHFTPHSRIPHPSRGRTHISEFVCVVVIRPRPHAGTVSSSWQTPPCTATTPYPFTGTVWGLVLRPPFFYKKIS